MQNYETILEVEHFTDDLFWFKTTKSDAWNKRNFIAGEFTMIGMPDNDIQRAYSIATSPKNDFLEFFSIKVQDGPLTKELQNVKVGDEIEVGSRPVGTLTTKLLSPTTADKSRLWCISTGTGLAPFLSIARDSDAYEQFDEVIVTHTCRTNAELVFGEDIKRYGARMYQTVTREDPKEGRYRGRITDRIHSGELFRDLEIDQDFFDPERDRIMICGGPDFNIELRNMFESQGWIHGTKKEPGQFVQEKAFVEVL